MENDTQVISGHQELPEVKYTKNRDFAASVAYDHIDTSLDTWQRWKGVKNTWSYTLTSLGSGLKTRYTRYHETDICYEHDGLLYLTPDGFYTNTTMRRLNDVICGFTNHPRVCIYQDKSKWWMEAFYKNGTKCVGFPFQDGLRMNEHGELVDHNQPAPRLDKSQFSQGVLLNSELMS